MMNMKHSWGDFIRGNENTLTGYNRKGAAGGIQAVLRRFYIFACIGVSILPVTCDLVLLHSVTIGETGQRIHGISLYYFLQPNVNLR